MQSIFPVLKYDHARAAIDFLERAFGFERHAVYDGENGGSRTPSSGWVTST
jgi:uncharacterized glyoxalase superfamily protein PhnB